MLTIFSINRIFQESDCSSSGNLYSCSSSDSNSSSIESDQAGIQNSLSIQPKGWASLLADTQHSTHSYRTAVVIYALQQKSYAIHAICVLVCLQ